MCGILIYTGAADKEGSLGGLVELGGMNKFLPLLKGAHGEWFNMYNRPRMLYEESDE